VIVSAAVLLLLAAGCGSGHSANTGANASAAGTPPQLKNIRQLQTVFNSTSREPTLVLLVAPT
jgi:hypothetical protein